MEEVGSLDRDGTPDHNTTGHRLSYMSCDTLAWPVVIDASSTFFCFYYASDLHQKRVQQRGVPALSRPLTSAIA